MRTGSGVIGRGPSLHPLEVVGAPRRRYLTALTLQLVSTAGLLTVATGLLVPRHASQSLLLTGALLALVGWAAARRCIVLAWSGLPASRRPRVMPVIADRRYALAAAVLLGGGATLVSTLGAGGGFLAAMIGLDTAIAAADSFRRLAGRDRHPARRVPALLTATAVSWTAAATVGGLTVAQVLLTSLLVLAVVAGTYALTVTIRPLVRTARR